MSVAVGALIFAIIAAPPALDLDSEQLDSLREKTRVRLQRPKPFAPPPVVVKTKRFVFVRDTALSLPTPPWEDHNAYAAAFEMARGAWADTADQRDRARMLLVFSTFDDGGSLFYLSMANDVRGLGAGTPAQIHDETPGSSLDGFAWLGDVDRLIAAGDSYFREAFIHEIAHRWSAYADPAILRGRQSMHWSFFANVGASPMEGNAWIDEGDGIYTAAFEAPVSFRFHALDLYLMGLLAPEEVPPLFVLEDVRLLEPADAILGIDAPPAHRQQKKIRVEARRTREVSIEEIVRLGGRREPAATNEHVVWPIGIVLLSNGLSNTTLDELAELDRRIAEYARDFEMATGGRMSLDLEVIGAGKRGLGEACDQLDDCDRLLADRCDSSEPEGEKVCLRSCRDCRGDAGTNLDRPDSGEPGGGGSLEENQTRGCGCSAAEESAELDLYLWTAVLAISALRRRRKSSRVW